MSGKPRPQNVHPYEAYRRLIRSSLIPKLSKRCDVLKEEGKLPFEGGWFTEEQIAEKRKDMKRRDREVLFGLAFVVMAAIAFIGFLFLLLLVAL